MRRAATWLAGAVLLGAVLAWGGALVSAPQEAAPSIVFSNYADGEAVRHVAPILRGTLADASLTAVTLVNESSDRPGRTLSGPAHQGRFVVLAELVEGENRLVLQAGAARRTLRLVYRPQTNPRYVRVAYLTDSSGDTAYETPLADDPQDYRGKLDTAMKVMQSFTAERLGEAGFGRTTFNLELDARGQVVVHTLRGPHTMQRYHRMSDDDLWSDAWEQVQKVRPALDAKWLVVPAYTRWDPATRRPRGHTALGGGPLAFFGGGDLFTWPDRLGDVHKAFSDARRVDPAKVFSDSVDRHTHWAIASTTIGAALHEIGHTLDLPHSSDPLCIMTRGHDFFNRAFTLVEPPHAGRKAPLAFDESEAARWSPPCALWLARHRFLAMDRRDWNDDKPPAFRYDRSGEAVTIHAPNGLQCVVACVRGDACALAGLTECQARATRLTLSVRSLAALAGNVPPEQVSLRAIDAQGLVGDASLDLLIGRRFVTTWLLAGLTAEWKDHSAFPAVTPERLADIVASARAARPVTATGALVDLLELMPPTRRDDLAAYAVRTLRCDQARQVRLRTGSDDSLRVWLNGKPVLEKLALRPARPDEDDTAIQLRKGDNVLVVECGQASGGWGFYLRLQDQKGRDLAVKDDGSLEDLGARRGR